LLRKHSDKIIVNVHGHCHAALEKDEQKGFTVVNAGALKEGNYGILQMLKSVETNQWRVVSVKRLNVD
jgi:Icc-related predicted phosphoesterase